MYSRLVGLTGIMSVSMATSSTLGQVFVEYYGASCSGSPVQVDQFNLNSDFTISPTSGHCYVRIYAVPSTGDMGRITVGGSGSNDVWVFVTTNVTFGTAFPSTVGCANWRGLIDTRGNIW